MLLNLGLGERFGMTQILRPMRRVCLAERQRSHPGRIDPLWISGQESTDLRRVCQHFRPRAWDGARVTQLIEKLAGRWLESLDILGRHIRPPIPETGSDGQPSMFCVSAGGGPCPSFMKTKHGAVVRNFQESAERRAFLSRTSDQ